MQFAHICNTSYSSLLICFSHTLADTQLNLAEPFLFCKTDTKSNLWNWQGPIVVCLVSLDHFPASQERKRGNKTVRISAIPTVIFITTTWVEREKGSQSTVKEFYHNKRFVKLTLLKLDFSHLEYKGMQSQEEMKKTNSEKVKQR